MSVYHVLAAINKVRHAHVISFYKAVQLSRSWKQIRATEAEGVEVQLLSVFKTKVVASLYELNLSYRGSTCHLQKRLCLLSSNVLLASAASC